VTPGWPLDRLRAVQGSDDVEYVADPLPVVILVGPDEHVPIRPRTIIRIGGQYLVEPADEPDNWCMGELNDGEIVCWGHYGTLERALGSL